MKRIIFVCFTLLALSACTTSSTGRNQVSLYSNAELNKMMITSFDKIKKEIPISNDKATNDFVMCVANAITENVPASAHQGNWEVVVFDSPQVNAFALPGGKIGVYTGILRVTENQDQLAAIIGHEVGHVRSGFAPKASVQLWKNMSKLSKDAPPEFMSTHPSNQTRIKQLNEHLTVSHPLYLSEKNAGNTHHCVKPDNIPESPKATSKK